MIASNTHNDQRYNYSYQLKAYNTSTHKAKVANTYCRAILFRRKHLLNHLVKSSFLIIYYEIETISKISKVILSLKFHMEYHLKILYPQNERQI